MSAEKASVSKQQDASPSRARIVWEYVSTLAIMALIVFSARSSLADWYEVPSGSMLPTIQLGDRIFVNKLAYDLRIPFTSISLKKLGSPARGDIVVFIYPEDNHTDYVKRLVGLPGDEIRIVNDTLIINGNPVSRRVVNKDRLLPGADPGGETSQLYVETLDDVSHFVFESLTYPAENYGPRKVPTDMYFMMGDNRDNSSDSRRWGFVPKENLRGRALRVVLSFDPSLPFWNPKRIRFNRSLSPLDPPSNL